MDGRRWGVESADSERGPSDREEARLRVTASEIDVLVRNGELDRAAYVAAVSGPDPQGVIDRELTRLGASGWSTEVEVVRVARARPIVLLLLVRATRLATLAVIVTGALLFWPMRLVALVPAFAAGLVVGELDLQLAIRRLSGLPATDLRMIRLLCDVSIYRAGPRRLGRSWSVVLGLAGLSILVWATWAGSDLSDWWRWLEVGAGSVTIVAGVWSILAARRVRRSGLRRRPPFAVETWVRSGPGDDYLLETPLVIRWPRPGHALAPVALLAMVGVPLAVVPSLGAFATSLVVLVAAALFAVRASQTRLVVDGEGISRRGVVRRRFWPWSEVRQVYLETRAVGGDAQDLRLVDRSGATTTLAEGLGRAGRSTRLARLVAEMNRRAGATEPVPSRYSGRSGLVAAVVLLPVVGVMVAASLGVLRARPVPSPEARREPGGEVAVGPPQAGASSGSQVVCPTLFAWLGGDREPECASATRSQAFELAVLVGLSGVVGAGMVSAARSGVRRRPRREAPLSSGEGRA